MRQMKALLSSNTTCEIIGGSNRQLFEASTRGDDLTIFIESQGYDEYIIFDNYVLTDDRISALSQQHIDHGDLRIELDPEHESICTSQYIYDSQARLVLVKRTLDRGDTTGAVITNDNHYRSGQRSRLSDQIRGDVAADTLCQ